MLSSIFFDTPCQALFGTGREDDIVWVVGKQSGMEVSYCGDPWFSVAPSEGLFVCVGGGGVKGGKAEGQECAADTVGNEGEAKGEDVGRPLEEDGAGSV